MFFSLKFLKKSNFDHTQTILIYKRSMNISRRFLSKSIYCIHRGLYPVLYVNKLYNKYYKFGMFSFARKPFAIPMKKKFNVKKR